MKHLYIEEIFKMHNGYIFMMQYVKSLEDQILSDNYIVGKELLKGKETFDDLLEKLYVSTLAHSRLLKDFEAAQSDLPEQKYNIEWMKSYGNPKTNSNEKVA